LDSDFAIVSYIIHEALDRAYVIDKLGTEELEDLDLHDYDHNTNNQMLSSYDLSNNPHNYNDPLS
jgi:hypothetical protein